ncbi:translational activator of cytochrome c oxidase 1 [Schistosoma bovis]|uniref:Translational activator of cytochrome c oxidase 1 n=1 Tax=Schistosoma bovis TaxID=6184 RepID=A0A430Q8U6_SCHBO|nr:translational activator of cytochrome c oxidase 1 [Schistosoma bovis]
MYIVDRTFQIPVHLFVNKINVFSTQIKRFAGHAHWQNVKHIKEAGDREKAQTALYYIKAAQKAIRDGGGIRDPKKNSKLATVLAEAKTKSVPYSTFDKLLSTDNQIEPYIIEIKAPGGLFVIVESRAKHVANERQRVCSIAKKYGFSLVPAGDIADKFFDHIGLVTVSAKSSKQLSDLDAATNLGIEIGAKEVELSSMHEIENLRQSLETIHHIPVINTQDIYSPKIFVPIHHDVRQILNEMYDKIKTSLEYVDRIFDNVINKSINQ